MRRVLLVVAAVGLMLPSSAHAETDDSCIGVGTMYLTRPITYVWAGPPESAAWFFGFSTGVCVFTPSLTATGVYTGWCDLSTGYGVTNTGNRFSFVGVGQKLVFTGEVVGEIPFIADPLSGSCVNGATHFLVGWGGTLLWGCKVIEQDGTGPAALGLPIHHKECV